MEIIIHWFWHLLLFRKMQILWLKPLIWLRNIVIRDGICLLLKLGHLGQKKLIEVLKLFPSIHCGTSKGIPDAARASNICLIVRHIDMAAIHL